MTSPHASRWSRLPAAAALLLGEMAALAAWGCWHASGGQRLVTHWNAAGQPDGSMAVAPALLTPVGLALVICLLFAAVPAMEPMQDKLEKSAPLLRTAWIGTLALLALAQAMVAAPLLHLALSPRLVLVGTGLLIMAIGNALPKSRPGFFVGIRTPWAILDVDNWIATHRFGARTMVAGGALAVVLNMLPLPAVWQSMGTLAAIIAGALAPMAYSYLYWRRGR
jgi:uncharacterized membrane protein